MGQRAIRPNNLQIVDSDDSILDEGSSDITSSEDDSEIDDHRIVNNNHLEVPRASGPPGPSPGQYVSFFCITWIDILSKYVTFRKFEHHFQFWIKNHRSSDVSDPFGAVGSRFDQTDVRYSMGGSSVFEDAHHTARESIEREVTGELI